MSWIAFSVGVTTLLAIAGPARWLRRAPRDSRIVFDMQLPSKWAAELTQQVLENEGTRSEIGQSDEQWLCRVTLGEHFEAKRCERLRAHFDQISRARGGGCATVRVVRGDDVVVYEAGGRRR